MPPVPRVQVNTHPDAGLETASLLNPSEAARMLGVSVKALKVYENRGLVRPPRAINGYRLYRPEDLGQLRRILALRSLGLSLSQIGTLLGGGTERLEAALGTHRTALCAERNRLDRAIALIDAARGRLSDGGTLGADEILSLARQTMSKRPRWHERLNAFYAAFLNDEQWKVVEAQSLGQWAHLIAELKALCATDADPATAPAQALFRRWMAAASTAAGGDPEIISRCSQAWTAAMDDPNLGPELPIGKSELIYLGRLHEAWQADS